jgi:AcrR family transcriptional regulator
MDSKALDTREKILKTAHELFAERSFAGVGIREIANSAGVNIAAINYHFSSKENLYHEVVKASFTRTAKKIEEIYQQNTHNFSEFCNCLLLYFCENSQDLRSGFRIFLVDENLCPDEIDAMDDSIGPPGGHILLQALQEHLKGEVVAREDLIWAVRVIFTHIIHSALILSCGNAKRAQITSEVMQSGLKRLVDLTANSLKDK